MVRSTSIAPGATLTLPWRQDFNALVYALSGTGTVGSERASITGGQLAVHGSGDISAQVSGNADINVMGSGDVSVTGGADCSINGAGSGEVRCS